MEYIDMGMRGSRNLQVALFRRLKPAATSALSGLAELTAEASLPKGSAETVAATENGASVSPLIVVAAGHVVPEADSPLANRSASGGPEAGSSA